MELARGRRLAPTGQEELDHSDTLDQLSAERVHQARCFVEFFLDDEDAEHRRVVTAASRAPEALPERGYGGRRTHLSDTRDASDVDAQLQRTGAYDRSGPRAVFDALLGFLADLS